MIRFNNHGSNDGGGKQQVVKITKPFASFVHSTSHSVYSMIELPDGTILTGSADTTIKRWDPSRGYQCIQTFTSHRSDVSCLVLLCNYDYNRDSPNYHNNSNGYDEYNNWSGNNNSLYDQDEFVSGSWDMSVKGWSLSSGLCTFTLSEHKNLVNCLVQLRHTRFVRGGKMCGIHCDDNKDDKEKTKKDKDSDDDPYGLGYSNFILASGSYDTSIKLWDKKRLKCILTLHGHTGSVETICEINDNGYIATGSWDKTIRIWDLVTGQRIQDIVEEHTDFVRGIVRVDRNALVSCSNDSTVKFWTVSQGVTSSANSNEPSTYVCCIKTSVGHSNKIYSIATGTASWNHSVVTGSGDQSVVGWDERGEVAFRCEPTSDIVMSLVGLRDGAIASGLWNGKVEIWKITTLSRLTYDSFYKKAGRTVLLVCFKASPDG